MENWITKGVEKKQELKNESSLIISSWYQSHCSWMRSVVMVHLIYPMKNENETCKTSIDEIKSWRFESAFN